MSNSALPAEFWKHLGKFDLGDYAPPRWSILVNDMGLQCTLYWGSSGGSLGSPPTPEKETVKAQPPKIETSEASAQIKAFQALLQHKLQSQLQPSLVQNKLMIRHPITTVQVPNRVPQKRKDPNSMMPKPDIDPQSKRVCIVPSSIVPCSSPNAINTLTPSATSSSHNSGSPKSSGEVDVLHSGNLLIDEGEEGDDDSIEDILKQKESNHNHNIINSVIGDQSVTSSTTTSSSQHQNHPNQNNINTPPPPALGGLNPALAKHINKIHQQNIEAKIAQQKLKLTLNTTNSFNTSNFMNLFSKQALSKLPNANPRNILNHLDNSLDLKEENDSDIEEISVHDEMNDSVSMGSYNSSSSSIQGQGQFGNSPPTGATREKMEKFIGDKGKSMDLELLRQRFSNPLARPTLTKFVYALTRLLFTDDEIIAPLRDLDQEKIDWIFDETYRMFPGCTYPTVKNAVGQVGRTKRYRAKYALGAKQLALGGNVQNLLNFGNGDNLSILAQGLPSLLNMQNNMPQCSMPQQLSISEPQELE